MWEVKMFDVRRAALFRLWYRFSKHKMTRCSKNLRRHCPVGPSWLRPCWCQGSIISVKFDSKRFRARCWEWWRVVDWRALFQLTHSQCSTAALQEFTSVTERFKSALYLVLSDIYNLLFLVKCARQSVCIFKMQQQQCCFSQARRNAVNCH